MLVSCITSHFLDFFGFGFLIKGSTHSSKQDCHHSCFQVCALQCASHFPSPNMTTYNIVTFFGYCFFPTPITAHKKVIFCLNNIKNLNTFFQDQASGHKVALKHLQELKPLREGILRIRVYFCLVCTSHWMPWPQLYLMQAPCF